MPLESTISANNPDYLFLQLYDRYVRQVADKCDIPAVINKSTMINQVDLSALSSDDQKGFEAWLDKNFYLRISIENALRRGMLVQGFLADASAITRAPYAVRIDGM